MCAASISSCSGSAAARATVIPLGRVTRRTRAAVDAVDAPELLAQHRPSITAFAYRCCDGVFGQVVDEGLVARAQRSQRDEGHLALDIVEDDLDVGRGARVVEHARRDANERAAEGQVEAVREDDAQQVPRLRLGPPRGRRVVEDEDSDEVPRQTRRRACDRRVCAEASHFEERRRPRSLVSRARDDRAHRLEPRRPALHRRVRVGGREDS
mmetsp:Transcript_10504/g.42475  ORF Transcript_10504/g.42475 Transcript_10504/m.42475 type:complete len:211 (-) Transcript_10504:221-853(-)